MIGPDRDTIGHRVLLLAPTVRDGLTTQRLLREARLRCDICHSLEHLCLELDRGAAVVILPEGAVMADQGGRLAAVLRSQPVWSDLPLLVLSGNGEEHPAMMLAMQALGNVSLMERPMRVSTLVSAVQAAMRARERQYQLRDHLEERSRAAEERAELLEAERAARSEAEKATRLKDEFLATLGHELRTPLNAILGWASLLTGGSRDPQDVRDGMEAIQRNARAQAVIIDDLLDMSRIMSGKVRLQPEPVELADVVGAAVETARPAAETKGVLVSIESATSAGCPTPLTVSGDPNRLQQVMWNLLSNAVKFTPEGGHVRVSMGCSDGTAFVSVADTGLGMSADFLHRVFERFRQADGSAARPQGGLGLGLSIVRNLIEMHGGTVVADSPGLGRGSTFTVHLPVGADVSTRLGPTREARLPEQADEPAPDCGSFDLSGLRVLCVDDEADVRHLVCRILEECGANVRTAASVDEALDLLDRLESANGMDPSEDDAGGELPHVLASDIGMPSVDGFEFVRRLRSRAGPISTIPAVAITAFARAEDRQRVTAAGYQAHVAKPVEPAALLRVIADLGKAAASR